MPFTARQLGRFPPVTSYEERNGRAATASQLLGSGVDLEAKDGPATAVA